MDGSRGALRLFQIPETLDYRGLLRPPGADDADRLDASEAEDPESWTPGDADAAIGAVAAATSRSPQECLLLLTRKPFCDAFNLARHFPNLDRPQQLSVGQALAALCSRAHDMLEKVPPSPYFSGAEAAANRPYVELERKILQLRTSHGHATSPSRMHGEGLLVKPSDMGQVLRSLCHLCVFLVCTAFRCATAPPKEGEKAALPADLAAGKKGRGGPRRRRRRRADDQGSINLVALELLADSLLMLTRCALRVPFSGEYGGMGWPDGPLLRLLMETVLTAMGSAVASSASDKLVDALSRVMRVHYEIMQERLQARSSGRRRSNPGNGDSVDAGDADASTESPGSSARTNEAFTDRGGELETVQVETDWLATLSDEVKKPYSAMVADALDQLHDPVVTGAVVNELLLLVREGFLLQASGATVQLMSSSVQQEYANVGTFLERLARKAPAALVGSLNELKQLFDVPSYNLRKSLMEAVKVMVIMARAEEDMGEELVGDYAASLSDSKLCARHREHMLQVLLARQYDAYMYARASLLKTFQDLIEAEALPIRWFVPAASLAISRLWDRGSQVRQRALNLLTVLISDATTKRFRLPLNAPSLKRDLGMIHAQLVKLDTITAVRCADGEPTEFSGGSLMDGMLDDRVGEGSGADFAGDMVERQKLLDELNEELGENIRLEDANALSTLRAKLEVAREMYADVYEIAEKVAASIDACGDMLKSSVEGDQRAAIKFLATCHLMGVPAASELLPRVWALSWSNNQHVVEAVLHEFRNVYFADGDDAAIAGRLVQLLSTSRLTAFASIEKMFEVNLARDEPYFANLDRLMVALLRIALAPNHQLGRDATPRVALGVMRLLLSSSLRSRSPQAEAIRRFDEKRLSAIRGLLQLSVDQSCTIFGELCLILAGATPSKPMEEAAAHVLELFMRTVGSTDDGWFRMAQCVVDVTFIHCKFAESLWSQTLGELLASVGVGGAATTATAVTVRRLAQVIFLCGHVAIRTIISMDRLQADLKLARSELEALEGSKGAGDASAQMGVASNDEQERDVFEQLCERNIVCANLLGGPARNLIVACLQDPLRFVTHGSSGGHHWRREDLAAPTSMPPELLNRVQREVAVLKTCAAIALCKFAAVSKRFCSSLFHAGKGKQQTCSVLEVVVSLLLNKRLAPGADPSAVAGAKRRYYYLQEPAGSALRATLLISYGDLLCRHPNLLEPWNDEVCAILLDRDNRVREAAVLVFTHLVMNDMVKPRGRLMDAMMFLTLDEHAKVADCARTFFHEVHRKNPNTIYNCFPEMAASLARNGRRQSVARNLSVLRMLLKFIRRDKQAESIVEKVCLRLQSTAAGDRTALVVYAHVLLGVCQDERCLAKLIASLPLVSRLTLECDLLLAALLLICKRAKSSHQGRKAGEGERGAEGAGAAAEASALVAVASAGGSASEPTSLKDLAEDLLGRLHSAFGEGRSPHVTQTAAAAESILAAAEADGPGEDVASCVDNLFIRDFGLVSAGADRGLGDAVEAHGGLSTPLTSGGFPTQVKSEAGADETGNRLGSGPGVEIKRECLAPADGDGGRLPPRKKPLCIPPGVEKATRKAAIGRRNEFDSSDEGD